MLRRYEEAVDSILELVEADHFGPGDALPTERDLATRLGVSRTVIRQAFGVLEERGLLRSVRGSGRYLRHAPPAGADDVRGRMEVASIADLLEARALLEVQAVGLACERRTGEQATQLLQSARRLVTWDDNLSFHTAIAAATQNFAIEALVRRQATLAGELHQRNRYADTAELERMRSEHEALAEAIAARAAEPARRLMSEHLRRTGEAVSRLAVSRLGG